MGNPPDERRALHALRDHIDCLLAEGASLVGRDPVQLSFQGRTLTVQHGMLVNESGHQDLIETLAEADASGLQLLRDAAEKFRFSARGYHRVLRVARTIADLDGSDHVARPHVAEAVSYRLIGMAQG